MRWRRILLLECFGQLALVMNETTAFDNNAASAGEQKISAIDYENAKKVWWRLRFTVWEALGLRSSDQSSLDADSMHHFSNMPFEMHCINEIRHAYCQLICVITSVLCVSLGKQTTHSTQ